MTHDSSSRLARFIPGLSALRGYRRDDLQVDVLAGTTLWAMLVPQSLGFAVLAGLPPVAGLYAAIGAMSLYWLWGSSRYLSVGAESTVAIMVASAIGALADPGSTEYLAMTAMLAIMVGGILLIGGLLRLGRIADFLSRPVLAGYVFGSGVLIVTSQLQGFFGTSIDPEPYLTKAGAVLRNLDQAAASSVMFGVATVVAMVAIRKFYPKVPGALIAIVVSMIVVAVGDIHVAVVGEFACGLPEPRIPTVSWSDLAQLAAPAAAVAALAYPDSVLTARSLATRDHDEIDANREFYGLGFANIGAGLLGGFPVNGSQSRSFVVADAGGRTQVASLVAVALAMLTLAFLAPVFDYLPTATLAGIVIVAGFGLLDITEFKALWRYRRSEFAMAVLTVVGVLGLGMLPGIGIAIGLSLLQVSLQAANPNTAVLGRMPDSDTYRDVRDHANTVQFPGLLLYRFDAPIFFANAGLLRTEVIRHVESDDRISTVVLNLESVNDIDATGAQILLDLLDILDGRGVALQMARVRFEIQDELEESGITARLSGEGIYLEVDDAVDAYVDEHGDVAG